MSHDESGTESEVERPRNQPEETADGSDQAPNSAVANPADLTELSPDGPHRTAPLFDTRPAVLKNPAELPAGGQHVDLAEAAFAKVTDDLGWVDKPVPTEAETEARRERHEAYKKKVRSARRRKKAITVTASVLAVLVLLGFVWFRYIFGGLERMPAVHGQAGENTPGRNFLMIGSNPSELGTDRRPRISWRDDFANSDLVMLVHLSRDNRSMYVISIPRDSAVAIPGHGIGKLPDAYGYGGAELYLKTVEEMTGIRLDRVMTLDLNAFREMADIFDGIVVTVPSAICDELPGPRRLDGQGALDYIALRPCMPNQDLDRVSRQQSLMKSLMRSAVDGGTVTHPLRVNQLLRSGAGHTTLENGFSYPGIFSTLFSLRHLRTSNTTFLTVPVAAQPQFHVGGIDYIRLDEAEATPFWEAVRKDNVAEYLTLSGLATS